MTDFSVDEIVRIYREEKTSREITELPEDFYQNVGKYISQLTVEMKRGDGIRRELVQEELKNVMRMVQDIHLARVLKGMNRVAQGLLPAPLIDRERYAFSEIRQSLEKLQAELVQPAIAGKVALAAPPDLTNSLLILLTEFPERIVGVDMKSYGPFTKGEIVSLPSPNAEIIVRHGAAKKITAKV